ncbi:hypothetical protein [Streptomyces sp. NPDC056464]|uniref:hypothetical protein n=1 Tax=Streptomyces sp. NPDC056464 TaxID=3345828 RepID=UPI0036A73536
MHGIEDRQDARAFAARQAVGVDESHESVNSPSTVDRMDLAGICSTASWCLCVAEQMSSPGVCNRQENGA